MLREGDIQLEGGLGITLPDSAGSIVLEDTAGNENDRLNYGEYFALQAENAYVSAVNLDSLEKRGPLNAVYRTAGLSRPVGGSTPQVLVISTTGTLSGVPSIGVLPEGYTGAESGSYVLERGGKAYEFNNHLGNVLAIISDKKLGQDTGSDDIAEYYEPETMMLTDYYPFGMAMPARTWQSSGYRYGFQGQEGDNEVVGEGNGYDFGARLYDGRVGRWWSVDPMAGSFKVIGLSGYSFNFLNPIYFVDLNGELPWTHLLKGIIFSGTTSNFGSRKDPISLKPGNHQGIDLAAKSGTEILSAARGTIVFAGNRNDGYGNQVVIDHGEGYFSRYAHIRDGGIRASVGEKVREGDVIGEVGSTGKSTGPHLHFEIRQGSASGNAIDPTSIEDLELLLYGKFAKESDDRLVVYESFLKAKLEFFERRLKKGKLSQSEYYEKKLKTETELVQLLDEMKIREIDTLSEAQKEQMIDRWNGSEPEGNNKNDGND